MYIVKHIPHGAFSKFESPTIFVTPDIETGKDEIQKRLGEEVEFEPKTLSRVVTKNDGKSYCEGYPDTTGERWQAQGPRHSHITITPIDFVE